MVLTAVWYFVDCVDAQRVSLTAQGSDGSIARRVSGGRADFLAVHAKDPETYPFLLESASVGTTGRYDLLLADHGERLVLTSTGLAGHSTSGSFLGALDDWFRQEHIVATAATDRAPFCGGWFLYLGYELAAQFESRLRLPPARGLIAGAFRVAVAAIYDHARDETWVVGEPGTEMAVSALVESLQLALQAQSEPQAEVTLSLQEDDPDQYLDAVRRALDYISAGDIYQANLARGWRGSVPTSVSAASLYNRLRRANPGPFAGIAALPGMTVLSTSPERLVRCRDGVVETRPIAGTRPRQGDDATVRAELRANTKEQAEHVMLLDLERNDIGRIATGGSVHVDEYMTVESYAHVHHIVSNVIGALRPDVTPGEVIRAVFPGGTITGCPKVRCMEIIAELEGRPRDAYTGSFGYLSRDGSLDLNILIRTATVWPRDLHRSEISLMAGAGIVADSDPQRELDETRAKARGLLRALTGSIGT